MANFKVEMKPQPMITDGEIQGERSQSAFIESLKGDEYCVGGVIGVRTAGSKLTRADITSYVNTSVGDDSDTVLTRRLLYMVLEGTDRTQNSMINSIDGYSVKAVQLAPGVRIELPILVKNSAGTFCVNIEGTDEPIGTPVYTTSGGNYLAVPGILIDDSNVTNTDDDGYGYVAIVVY